jgi:hypothetical protein
MIPGGAPVSAVPVSSGMRYVVVAAGGFIPYPRPRGLVGGMLNMSGGKQK